MTLLKWIFPIDATCYDVIIQDQKSSINSYDSLSTFKIWALDRFGFRL